MLAQNSPEWLEFRKTKIGASDAPIIMETSPWKTPYQLWEEKMGVRESPVTAAMQRGTNMEEEARWVFEEMIGIQVFATVKIHPTLDWMMASLDGIDVEERHIVEIKCPGAMDHGKAMDGVVPDKYYPQLQHQMAVTGLDGAFYFSYTRSSSKIIEVQRDDKYISEMIQKERQFYNHMIEFTPPVLTERDYIARDDPQWHDYASQYISVKKQLNILEEQEKGLRKHLISLSEKSNSSGAGIKLSRIVRRGHICYDTVPELVDVDLEKYRKPPIEFWKISEI